MWHVQNKFFLRNYIPKLYKNLIDKFLAFNEVLNDFAVIINKI
jgi:hypothetical protein